MSLANPTKTGTYLPDEIGDGLMARLGVTDAGDDRVIAGCTAWASANLADLLAPLGWHSADVLGLEVDSHPWGGWWLTITTIQEDPRALGDCWEAPTAGDAESVTAALELVDALRDEALTFGRRRVCRHAIETLDSAARLRAVCLQAGGPQ